MARAREQQDGFTLVELLVVVLIVGVLAGIALPVYLHQRDKAADGAAQTDLRAVATKIEMCATETADYRMCVGPTATTAQRVPLPPGVSAHDVTEREGYTLVRATPDGTSDWQLVSTGAGPSAPTAVDR